MKKNNDLEGVMSGLSKDKWKRIGVRKRAGVVVPLFHVYSKKSVGIGDLEDMKLLIDWCEGTGNSILQLLPMNEVGAVSCPYDSISSFALEPVYLSLTALPGADKKSFKEAIAKLKKKYPAGPAHVDYSIRADKAQLVRDMFLDGDFSKDAQFKKFISENSYWIEDFAMFKALKDHNNGKAWYEWEGAYKDRDKDALKDFRDEHKPEISFHMWVQWQLFKQLKAAKDYANKKGVLLKGDLPILVSKDSADVWSHPEFFKLGSLAGAPPDMYCAKGQRWGMPIYDWGA
ncbi:MAG: 4-alpha-glucanotransferase, partial [Candidatus Omnitrophota bacterium]